ncbi:MAG: hypothetical protein O3A84_02860 [Proteobacteria bacterium]|nr:hypothetical protein [Pseudomonadota bacterium]
MVFPPIFLGIQDSIGGLIDGQFLPSPKGNAALVRPAFPDVLFEPFDDHGAAFLRCRVFAEKYLKGRRPAILHFHFRLAGFPLLLRFLQSSYNSGM